MFKNPVLRVDEGIVEDTSINRQEYFYYNPISGTQLNSPGNITINIEHNDNFFYPASSYLEFRGQVEKAGPAGGAFDQDNGKISFVNFGPLHLFDFIKYQLNNGEVESVYDPGQVANIFGLATRPSAKGGISECWYPDTGDTRDDGTNEGFKQRRNYIITSAPDPVGSFGFTIPLSAIFGFADDFDKIVYGFRHTLVLTRGSSDDNALCRHDDKKPQDTDVYPPGKVTLKSIRWKIQRIEANDVAKYELMQTIKSEATLNCAFRMRQCININVDEGVTDWTWRVGIRSMPEQPRWVFLAFQVDRNENQLKVNTVYDNCDLENAYITLNNDRYPLVETYAKFKSNQYDHLYTEFQSFKRHFFGIDRAVSPSVVNLIDYKNLFPILCFDVSKQSERLKSSISDIEVRARFNTPIVGKKTRAVLVIISDRKLRFKSDGEKMSVVY